MKNVDQYHSAYHEHDSRKDAGYMRIPEIRIYEMEGLFEPELV